MRIRSGQLHPTVNTPDGASTNAIENREGRIARAIRRVSTRERLPSTTTTPNGVGVIIDRVLTLQKLSA